MSSAVAGGASTISLSPDVYPANWPKEVAGRSGAYAWVRPGGLMYIDYVSRLLSVLLGHAHREVAVAVMDAAEGVEPSEEGVAQTVRRLCGYPEGLVRFSTTGTHACETAIRVARAVTGRPAVLSIGYHGWSDAVVTPPPAWGVPQRTRSLTTAVPWGSLEAVKNVCWHLDPVTGKEDMSTWGGDDLACVIIDPVTLDSPPAGYLEGIKKLAQDYGFLVVYDECITGGRYEKFTYGHTHGPLPDLCVVSKGLANGNPLAAVVGSADLLSCFDRDYRPSYAPADGPSGPVYCSGTWSAPTLSLAAAEATLAVWEREDVPARLTKYGQQLGRALHADDAPLRGQPYRWLLDVRTPDGRGTDYVGLTLLRQMLVEEGLLLGTGLNLMLAHCSDAVFDETVTRYQTALKRWRAIPPKEREAHLIDGHVCVPPYRQG